MQGIRKKGTGDGAKIWMEKLFNTEKTYSSVGITLLKRVIPRVVAKLKSPKL